MVYKYCLAFAVIGFVLSYYLWFSPVLLLCIFIVSLLWTICLIHMYVKKEDEIFAKYGCIGILIFIVLCPVALFLSSECYISAFGGKRHLYADCYNAADVHEVTELGALLWGCTEECQLCEKRKQKEKQEKIKKKKEERNKLQVDFLTRQIAELDSVKRLVLKGEDIDIREYEFRHNINFEQEYDDGGFEPRGYR